MISERFCQPRSIAPDLKLNHYLGSLERGIGWRDEYGVIVLQTCTSFRLPTNWLELARWCITSKVKNAGSQQWRRFAKDLRAARPDISTIVSYSDPAQGHTGALYRACNWWWAPTWHRLRPPPSGNGSWSNGVVQGVKDRWIFALQDDPNRMGLLKIRDKWCVSHLPWAEYREPGGADYKRFTQSVDDAPSKA